MLGNYWKNFIQLVLTMWRDDMTTWLRERSSEAGKRSPDAYDWKEEHKLKMIKEMIEKYVWKLYPIQRINYIRNSFMDGPIKIGNLVWVASEFGRQTKELYVGQILTVKDFMHFHSVHA